MSPSISGVPDADAPSVPVERPAVLQSRFQSLDLLATLVAVVAAL